MSPPPQTGMTPVQLQLAYSALGYNRVISKFMDFAGFDDEQGRAFVFQVMQDPMDALPPAQQEALLQWCESLDYRLPDGTVKAALEAGAKTKKLTRREVLLAAAPAVATTSSVVRNASMGVMGAGALDAAIATGRTRGKGLAVHLASDVTAAGLAATLGKANALADVVDETFMIKLKGWLKEQKKPYLHMPPSSSLRGL